MPAATGLSGKCGKKNSSLHRLISSSAIHLSWQLPPLLQSTNVFSASVNLLQSQYPLHYNMNFAYYWLSECGLTSHAIFKVY